MVSLKFVRTVALHCKKPEVGLTRNIISVAIWIHPGPGGCPHPIAVVLLCMVSLSSEANSKFGCTFCNCIFLANGGGTQAIFMYH